MSPARRARFGGLRCSRCRWRLHIGAAPTRRPDSDPARSLEKNAATALNAAHMRDAPRGRDLDQPKQTCPCGVHASGLSVRYSFALQYGCCAGLVWGKGLRVLALILALFSLLGIMACGGSGSSTATITAVTVSCTPTSVQSGQTSSCTSTVTGTGN